jgi:hypothetical protein
MQVLFDVQRTTARWTNNVIEVMEKPEEQFIASFTKMLEAGIGHRLAAACLPQWETYFYAQLLQELQRSNAHARIELVNVTGNEKSGSHTMCTVNLSMYPIEKSMCCFESKIGDKAGPDILYFPAPPVARAVTEEVAR